MRQLKLAAVPLVLSTAVPLLAQTAAQGGPAAPVTQSAAPKPEANPLIDPPYRLPFDKVKAAHVEPAVLYLLSDAQQGLAKMKADTSKPTYANTVEALEKMGERLERAMGIVSHLNGVATSPEMRAAVMKVQPALVRFNSSITLDPVVFGRLQAFAATEEAKRLDPVRKRAFTETLDSFKRNGALLNDEQKKRLAEISVEQSRLSTQFSNNVLDATNSWELVITDEAKLKGLPETARAAAAASAKRKNVQGWRFTLQQPDVQAILTYADDAALREQVYRASNARANGGKFDNTEIMKKQLQLRAERAKLLGYKNFADLQTAKRMAGSGDKVRQFLTELEQKTRPAYEKENAELLAFRRSVEGPNAPEFKPWDVTYYAEKQRQKLFSFDDEELRPYFPVNQVMTGMFDLVNKLYGIKVEQVKEPVPVWDDNVQYYTIKDEDGTVLASFYADWFPRENKRAGAWMSGLIVGESKGPRKHEPHLGTINGNFNRPVDGKPALMNHREVETIFHEFGHLLHLALTQVPVKSLAGTNVAWDFVELPSQIMENWTWEKPMLDLFAKHYETGKPIPQELYDKLQRARTYRAANAQMRQIGLAMMDLQLHTDYVAGPMDKTPTEYGREVMQRYNSTKLEPDFAMANQFAHIFAGGYAAGYYSYKWAEVLDADAFTRFKQEGLFSRKAGSDFRRAVLEKGNSEEAGKLYRDFMGRDPKPDALLKRQGL